MTYDYENGIYPRRLVITDKFEYADKYYLYPDGDKLKESTSAIATVYGANTRRKPERGDVVLVIWRPKDVHTGIIAHEAFHIGKIMLEYLPVPLDDSTEEAWAYLIEWAANCVQDFLNKLSNKENKTTNSK